MRHFMSLRGRRVAVAISSIYGIATSHKTLLAMTTYFSLLCVSARAAALTTYVTESGQTRDALPQVLVKYKPGRSAGVKSAVLRSVGAASRKEIGKLGIQVVPVPKGQTLQSFVAQLKRNDDVEFAEPDGVLRAFTNDPDFSTQYSIKSDQTKVVDAWSTTTGSPTVVVAVIDTGITLTHQDLVNQLWTNPSPSGTSGLHGKQIEIDWDGDGDCTETDPRLGPEQCASGTPTDDNNSEYHGTRVSGIIAAETNNALNMAGVAYGCRIMAVKALNADGLGSYSAIAEAIEYATDNGATVINMSLGGDLADGSDAVIAAVNRAIDNNIVVVAAAGNNGNASPVSFPASISSVIAVGATDSSKTLAVFSCTGNSLDLVAPGVGILSTIPPNSTSSSGGDGTSFSAPIVAGVAALIRSISPNMSVADVTKYIDFTATDLGSGGFDKSYGFGLLNAAAAVQAAQTGVIPVSNASPNETYPYPNPFRPLTDTSVTISVPSDIGTSGLEITFYNVAGERVRTLTGTQHWDGKNDSGNLVASGFYFYIARTSRGDAKGKITVIK